MVLGLKKKTFHLSRVSALVLGLSEVLAVIRNLWSLEWIHVSVCSCLQSGFLKRPGLASPDNHLRNLRLEDSAWWIGTLKKKNPSEWWCYYFCVYTLGSAPGHYLDPRPLDVIASKSKDRLPASACHLTSTGCQTDVSFHLSPDGPHILSIKVSFSFSCDYRCLGKFAEKYWSSP